MSAEGYLWIAFGVVVAVALALDLGVFHRRDHVIKPKEALLWSLLWITLSLVFSAAVFIWDGRQRGTEFLTAYLIEESLSVDNLFVFAVIFSYFRVPAVYQHRVLFWGIIGAIVMRGVAIVVGVTLLEQLQWMFYLFGGFLIFTGVKLGVRQDISVQPEKNIVARVFKRFFPVTPDYVGHDFFTRHAGKLAVTPLFLVLLVVESSDLVFAIDSIPAVLAVSRDTFIVYSSNVFAILGLRALYFLLAHALQYFYYLKYGLAVILVFVGAKMILAEDVYKIPTIVSLGAVAGVLSLAIAASILRARSTTRPVARQQVHTEP